MPPAVPDAIPCSSAKDLRYALDPLRPLIEQPETEENWEKISRALQTVAALARGGAGELDVEYVKELRTFSGMILNSMNSERTRLGNVAVDLFTVLAPALGHKFEPLISLFVPTLVKLVGRTNKVFVARATAGLRAIISNCPHVRILVELRIMATDKSASLRVIVAGAILQCLSEWDWSVPSFAAKVGEIETFMRSAGTDSNVDVRKIARQTFELYQQMFPDRVHGFVDPLTPTIKRYLDIKPGTVSGPAPRKPAPVPAPRFPERRPAPSSVPAPQEETDSQPSEPLPKKIRVGLSRTGPSRAAVPDLGPVAVSAPLVTHPRVVSGPARVAVAARDVSDPAKSGPMRAVVPSTVTVAPTARSVSSSGPSRMRIDPPTSSASVPTTADPSSSSQPGAPRRFRPNRAPMDPSQMPQRVLVVAPAPKPNSEPKKIDGPSRVNLGNGVKGPSGAPMAPPARVVSTAKREREVKESSLTSSGQAHSTADSSPPEPPVTTPEAAVTKSPVTIPPPESIPIPASAPVSRPASAVPFDSRPASVASTATSMAPSTSASVSVKPASTSAAAPAKPPLVSSKSAPTSSKISAIIRRGNPNAPPPFVPKRTGGGAGAATVSQMAKQREAIAAREKREAEEAAKKAKWDAAQKKSTKGKETKDKTESAGPSKSSRSKREDAPSSKPPSARSAPAAPRKVATLSKASRPKVDVKDLEPDMVAPVMMPLPASPTPPEVEPVVEENAAVADTRELPAAESQPEVEVQHQEAVEEPEMEEKVTDELDMEETPASATDEPIADAPTADTAPAEDVLMSDDVEEPENDADERMDEADQTVVVAAQEPVVHTPPRVSLIDQTPSATPATGFAFHPMVMQLPPMPSPPIDFLVDIVESPPRKEYSAEKEGANRFALGEMNNTNTMYLTQFGYDMLALSGL